jgi:GTP-binding protein Era
MGGHEAVVHAQWEVAATEVARAMSEQVVLAFLGSASAGKDAAIKALFDVDFGEIDPIPGSTARLRVAAVDPEGRFLVANAPGFGDLRDEVEAEARRALEHLDVAIYLVNADGGATIDEKRDLDAIRALGRPTLVCLNKIDLIRPAEREAFVAATLAQLGVRREDAAVTAFDPLPALAAEPMGVDEVSAWLTRTLADGGKGLLVAKHLRQRLVACDALIRRAAKQAAIAGAIPVPGADATAVTVIQIRLITDIAAVFGRRVDRDVILFILGEALAGSSKGFLRWAVNALKAAGWIPGTQIAQLATSTLGATIASASTWGIGKAAIAYMQRDGLSGEDLRDVFDVAAEAWRHHQAALPGPTEAPR